MKDIYRLLCVVMIAVIFSSESPGIRLSPESIDIMSRNQDSPPNASLSLGTTTCFVASAPQLRSASSRELGRNFTIKETCTLSVRQQTRTMRRSGASYRSTASKQSLEDATWSFVPVTLWGLDRMSIPAGQFEHGHFQERKEAMAHSA